MATATLQPAPTVNPEDKPVRGGTIVWRTVQDAPTLDTTIEQYAITFTMDQIYNGLVTYPVGLWSDDRIIGDLAESWSFTDDGTTLTFKINPEARWQDLAPVNGRRFVSGDFKHTFDWIRDPEHRTGLRSRFDGITAVETPDDGTIVLRLEAPSAVVLSNLAWSALNMVAPEVADMPGAYAQNPIGTGAFFFVERQPNVLVRSEANPQYWKKDANDVRLPYADATEVLTIPDAATAQAALLSGQVMFSTPGGSRDGRDGAQRGRDNDGTFVYSDFDLSARAVFFNWSRAPFDDVRVRKAIHMAVDYGLVRDNVTAKPDILFEGYVTNGLQDFAYPQDLVVQWKTRDVEGAKALMADAGLAAGFKTNLVNNFPGQAWFGDAMAIIKQNLAEINIDVEIVDPPGIAAAYGRRFSSDFDMLMSSMSFEGNPVQWLARNYLSTSSNNWGKTLDPTMDKLIMDAMHSFEKSDLQTKIRAAQDYMVENVPGLIFSVGEINIIQVEALKGYRRHWAWGHAGVEWGWLDPGR